MLKLGKKLLCAVLSLLFVISCAEGLSLSALGAPTASQKAYIEEIGTAASEDMQTSGILASLTVSQAIMEAGWGTSTLAQKAKNLFGMKAYSSWPGMVIDSNARDTDGTTGKLYPSYSAYVAANSADYVKTNTERVWRAYSSWAESLADHSKLLTAPGRYDKLPGEYDYVAACWNIIEAGYAFDMEYTKKIINCIEMYDLSRFDVMDYGPDDVVVVTKTRVYLPVYCAWQLPVTVIQPFGAEDELTYSSNNEEVAYVDDCGVVIPLADGECLITVTSSTGWKASCYLAVYSSEKTYGEYTCYGDINIYAEPDVNSEKYGYLPSRHCVIGVGEKFADANGEEWMQVHSKIIAPSGVVLKTGYVKASGLKFVQTIKYDQLRDTTSLVLDQSEVTLPAYTSKQLTATPLDAEGKDPSCLTVRWISDNPQVATVFAGKVKGVGEGECTIYAVSPDGVYTSCKVTVTPGVYVPVEGVSLDQTEISLDIAETAMLTATVNPADATEPELSWSSSDNSVAKVVNGKVTPVGIGECDITVTVGDFTASCKVTVTEKVYEGVKYDGAVHGNQVNLRQGPDTSYGSYGYMMEGDKLIVYGEPENNWYKVSVVSGNCAGFEGYIYYDFVRIHEAKVESLKITTPDTLMKEGDTLKLECTVSPEDTAITFASAYPEVAVIDSEGNITAISEGETIISAQAGDLTDAIIVVVEKADVAATKYMAEITTNGGTLNVREGMSTSHNVVGKFAYGAQITVYGESQNGWYSVSGISENGNEISGYASAEWITIIGKYAQSFTLTADSGEVNIGSTYSLSWIVSPEDVVPTFTVSDESIATVDEKGVITAHKEGTVVITAQAGGKSESFVLSVLPAPAEEKFVYKEGFTQAGGYLFGISEGTEAQALTEIFDNDQAFIKVASDKRYFGTGTVILLTNADGNVIDKVTVIVYGDCNGDGMLTALDYLVVRMLALGLGEHSEIQSIAARVSGGSTVSAIDCVMVRNHFLGNSDLYDRKTPIPEFE